jgi:hypothetical protein
LFQFEDKLNDQQTELELSRKAKEEALKQRMELEQKHDVLRAYFNQVPILPKVVVLHNLNFVTFNQYTQYKDRFFAIF